MGETTVSNENAPKVKKSFFKGLKAEFKKIVWPSAATVRKEAVAVLLTSVALGLIIAILDFIIKFGINLIL